MTAPTWKWLTHMSTVRVGTLSWPGSECPLPGSISKAEMGLSSQGQRSKGPRSPGTWRELKAASCLPAFLSLVGVVKPNSPWPNKDSSLTNLQFGRDSCDSHRWGWDFHFPIYLLLNLNPSCQGHWDFRPEGYGWSREKCPSADHVSETDTSDQQGPLGH